MDFSSADYPGAYDQLHNQDFYRDFYLPESHHGGHGDVSTMPYFRLLYTTRCEITQTIIYILHIYLPKITRRLPRAIGKLPEIFGTLPKVAHLTVTSLEMVSIGPMVLA